MSPITYQSFQISLIYLYYLNMLKVIRGFWLCVDKFRFRAAEAVLKIAYEQKQQQKISVLTINDKIFQRLGQLVEENKIDQKTSIEFKNMFLPSKGIKIQDIFLKKQNNRLQNGISIDNLLSFSLDTFIMSLILKQKYTYDENGKLKLNFVAQCALQLVGASGLGKSIKFICSKILHDMRIRELIKNGMKEQSIFSQNFKYLYFHIETPEKQIMLRILEEVKRDFDQVPEEIAKVRIDEQNFQKFISKVSSAYLQKQIRLRLIIDQIHTVCNLKQREREKQIDKWRQIRGSFEMPVMMISSKNNPYQEKYDPVIYFANSSKNDVKHKKVILDNFITPDQRLNYSYSCLAFQLEKYLNRDETIKILQNISIPILTHLSITNAVRNAFREFEEQNEKISKKKLSLIQILNIKLNQNEDLNKFCKMTKQTHFSESEMKQCLDFMSNFLSFSCKETQKEHVRIQFGIKNSRGQVIQIQKQMSIQKKRQKEGIIQTHTESNYFFSTIVNNDNYVFTCISIKQMEKVRMEIMYYTSRKFLQILRKKNQNQFHKFIKQNADYMFQAFIPNLYNIGLKKNNYVESIIIEIDLYHKINIMSENIFYISEQASYKNLFHPNCQFLRSGPKNPAFDFILTQCQTNNKHLTLISTSVSAQIQHIIKQFSKFKRVLFEKNLIKGKQTNFRREIFKLLQSNSQSELEIVCFVLTSIQNKEVSQNKFQVQDLQKNQNKILDSFGLDEIKEEQTERMLILQGRQNFNSFLDQLRQKGLEKRFKIHFLKEDRFIILSDLYSSKFKNQILYLPIYLGKVFKSSKDSQN